MWHCLYLTEFLKEHQLTFDEEVKWSEDNIFSAFAGYYADSFYYLKGEGLYHYYNNPGTITTAYRPGAWNVYCTMNRHLHQFFDSVGQSGESKEKQMEIRKRILNSQELKEAFAKFSFPKEWSWKLKLQVMLMKHKWKKLYSILIG